jgi:hypothetical protein
MYFASTLYYRDLLTRIAMENRMLNNVQRIHIYRMRDDKEQGLIIFITDYFLHLPAHQSFCESESYYTRYTSLTGKERARGRYNWK